LRINILKTAFLGLILSLGSAANAGVITGLLDYDSTSGIITNTQTGLTYFNWGEADGLTYQQTIDATDVGGIYEGYHIANSTEGMAFFDAATINKVNPTGTVFILNPEGILPGDRVGGTPVEAWAWFLSDSDGFAHTIHIDNSLNITGFEVLSNYRKIADTNIYNGNIGGFPAVSWLLVEDEDSKQSIPEPSTFAIFALGLIGLASRRFKKQ